MSHEILDSSTVPDLVPFGRSPGYDFLLRGSEDSVFLDISDVAWERT
jgi:hypothetical protein